MKVSEIVEKLSASVVSHSLTIAPQNDPDITGVAAIDEATAGTLSYADGQKFGSQVDTTAASVLILPPDAGLQARADERGIPWIATRQPRLMFAQAIALFYQPFKPAPAIHPTAVIDPTAQIGVEVAIGAHVVIQANTQIGDGVVIHPNVVVYPGARVGDRTVLHANCVIHERSIVGADCVIHAGAVIGSEGFGFVPTREGWLKMEQSGYTVLEDGVEIGCNSNVDRPAVGETRIGRNTKVDNLVQIGHGVTVGEACAFASGCGLAGGTTIGNRVILAGQVGVANNAKIGDGAIASAKAGVHKDVPPGVTVSGYPAVEHKVYLKASAMYSHLYDMYLAIRQIQKQLGIQKIGMRDRE
ncbi:MAG: UDP-3-O-(3-hydroxymyristoyl)glucosamine N-acyltransferase [Leptolyngbyaceae cyanobacterium CSU_1_3]|nr:UDP-3-O-(3-hydroxymyristoyl)glucosamine N-acyltransferase [Leptolyngbyaceae cyanobacterium CSU_1_3]